MPKKYNDDMDKILEGDKEPPVPPPAPAPPEEDLETLEIPPVKEGKGYASWSSGSSKIGVPEKKVPAPALVGEEEVRHRSKGKGKHGLPHNVKRYLSDMARELNHVLSAQECQWLAQKYMEWGEKEQKQLEEWREKYKDKSGVFWHEIQARRRGDPIDRARYIAKELRSHF